MEYVTQTFKNTSFGLREKDRYSRYMATQGYRIISEQVVQGHIKGGEACCLGVCCLPSMLLAGRTPGSIIVTYGREASQMPVQPISQESTPGSPMQGRGIAAEIGYSLGLLAAFFKKRPAFFGLLLLVLLFLVIAAFWIHR
jgi:hypothetical protein